MNTRDVPMPSPGVRRREIFGWAMFDFAGQAYTLLIITVVFGDLFTRVIVGDAQDGYRLGNLLWSVSLALGYLVVVLAAPMLGAVLDITGGRKRALAATTLVTAASTALLYFVEPGLAWLGVALMVVSNAAYCLGEGVVASWLPRLGRADQLGTISGFGWALGYVGGLVATGFALAFLGEASAANFERVRWVGPFAAAFMLLAAVPTFLLLREPARGRALPLRAWPALGWRRVRRTLVHLKGQRDLALLLASIFFSLCGISIIVAFTFIYGAQVIGWDEPVRVAMFVIVQVTAAAGAFAFGVLQDRAGARFVYGLTLLAWVVAVLAVFATPDIATWARRALGVDWQAQHVFLAVGVLAGSCLGSAQSAGRALVAVLAPPARAAELFGFWNVAGRAAAIVGLVGIGLLQAWLGLRHAILFRAVLFAASWLVLMRVDVARGRRAAGTA